jgi:hypothetical protein
MNTKERVKDLIELIPQLRDNDEQLCCHIWFRELEKQGIDPFEFKVTDFFKAYSKQKYTSAPSIKRARAKLQEENPNLRGEKYNLRKGKYQKDWRKKLGYEKN